MMISTTLADLSDFLLKRNTPFQIMQDTQQIFTMLQQERIQLPLFIRIFHEDLLQFMVFMPFNVPKNRVETISRLLHLFNKEIDLPGFGLDEQSAVPYYRIMLPTDSQAVSADLLVRIMDSVKSISCTYLPLIAFATQSNESLEGVIEQLKQKVPA